MPTSERKVSLEYIAHYTRKFENLCSILESHHFQIHYCLENYYFIKKGLHIHIPMVCFTDLPNGISGKHKRRYGNYAIVFNKEWATNKHISPILYLRKDGQFTDTIRKIYKLSDISINNELFAFCKPYCAKYYDHKKGKWSENNRRFYDEREWRYVPKDYLKYSGSYLYQDEVLDFELSDIEKIYVPNTKNAEDISIKHPSLKEKIQIIK